MGLPKLRAWMRQTMPKCFAVLEKKKPLEIDHIFVDINFILHLKAHRSASSNSLMIQVVKKLRQIIQHGAIRVTRQLFLSVDGPPPIAKMLLQRSRRIKSGENRKKCSYSRFDTRQITPGCMFMDDVERYLEHYACKHLAVSPKNAPQPSVIISGPSVPGEGELKIIETIVKMQQDAEIRANERFAILGSDTDIILQTIAANVDCLVIDSSTNEVFSVESFYKSLESMVPGKDTRRVALDFAALVLFSGNDYLPKLPKVPISITWAAYIKYSKTIQFQHIVSDDAKSFCTKALLDLLETIKIQEPKLRRKPSASSTAAAQNAESSEEEESEKEIVININPINTSASNSDIFVPKINLAKATQQDLSDDGMVKQYLEGTLWCLHMFRNGKCVNFSFRYSFKRPPTVREVISYLKRNTANIHAPIENNEALPAAVCASMVVQSECKSFIEPRLRPLMDVFQSLIKVDFSLAGVAMQDAYNQMQQHYMSLNKPFDVRNTVPYALVLRKPTYINPLASPESNQNRTEVYIPNPARQFGDFFTFNNPFWKVKLDPGEGINVVKQSESLQQEPIHYTNNVTGPISQPSVFKNNALNQKPLQHQPLLDKNNVLNQKPLQQQPSSGKNNTPNQKPLQQQPLSDKNNAPNQKPVQQQPSSGKNNTPNQKPVKQQPSSGKGKKSNQKSGKGKKLNQKSVQQQSLSGKSKKSNQKSGKGKKSNQKSVQQQPLSGKNNTPDQKSVQQQQPLSDKNNVSDQKSVQYQPSSGKGNKLNQKSVQHQPHNAKNYSSAQSTQSMTLVDINATRKIVQARKPQKKAHTPVKNTVSSQRFDLNEIDVDISAIIATSMAEYSFNRTNKKRDKRHQPCQYGNAKRIRRDVQK
ncbi:hypothetical protein BATDEDRAFT_34347 [Batrachochytrium dendrobatidis JAM81]|uniref:Xrn1 N-terminal domain-containing protein n=2 Tax=Batrachochytrium dendrobatidis TaxID=109871 RepID=F4NX74_BATDJ|nr:uncharacterized protein BATDEDRAFT_34347 [Batrachochytrium dendrobatidis JAM81]EGF82313.1 hypothetical protein BATDEDRAFT_34347 [Batrachochytrium dendrobatidis JAM81]OAJ40011.1 hypothetical protein BDEG_23791 [Batrachochytrium dendrobatidis JEL423]|eukprot:XP_006676764.1 hypothetical protein BATDEDRAFT_34347 [Batrachochytrium dendrobatidis JAM81]